jgi:hypothetical protein
MIGLSTSAISNTVKLPLFQYGGRTGLLLLDPQPVFSAPYDIYSKYFETWDGKPSEALGGASSRLTINILNTQAQEEAMHDQLVSDNGSPLDFEQSTSRTRTYTINPRSEKTIERARVAYGKIIREGNENYTEVCVNTTLENAAGILAYNEHELINSNPGSPAEWAKALDGKIELVLNLRRAFEEVKLIKDEIEEYNNTHDKKITREPTVVIYQPPPILKLPSFAGKHLLHFPPTEENKAILDTILKQAIPSYPDRNSPSQQV